MAAAAVAVVEVQRRQGNAIDYPLVLYTVPRALPLAAQPLYARIFVGASRSCLWHGGLDVIKCEVGPEELSASEKHSSGHEVRENGVLALDAFIPIRGRRLGRVRLMSLTPR